MILVSVVATIPVKAVHIDSPPDWTEAIYHFDNQSKEWSWYISDFPPEVNTLHCLTEGTLYWMYLEYDCTIDGTNLYSGWNLVVWQFGDLYW